MKITAKFPLFRKIQETLSSAFEGCYLGQEKHSKWRPPQE